MLTRNAANYRQGGLMPLSDAMNQLLSGAFTTPFGLGMASTGATNMNLYETNDSYILQLPLPGIQPGQLNVTARENIVTLQGTVEFPAPQGARTLFTGSARGQFREMVQLPGDVDGERATAVYQNGVLTLTLPKAASARDRTIHVSVEGNGQDQSQVQGENQPQRQEQH